MDSASAIIAAVVIAVVLLGGAAVGQLAYQESAPSESNTVEFNTSGIGSTYQIDATGEVYFDDTVNVTNASGVGMVEPDDYTFDESNGTLEVQSDRLANQVDASIDYTLSRPTQQQAEFADRLATLSQTAYFIPLIIIFALVIIAVGMLGGLS